MKVEIRLVQFARQRHGKSENIERMTNRLKEIDEADIVCLPENWFGVDPLREEEIKALISQLRKIASKKSFNLLTGGGYLERDGKMFDSSYVIDREGNILGYSDKLFPSESVGEMELLTAGENVHTFEIDGLKIGIIVCIDAVYPDVSQILASRGAKIIFNPSNIPKNRLRMWKHIGITRAVENGVFFVFVNNTSTHYPDGREVTGHSFVASPDGEIIIQADEAEQVISFKADLAEIEKLRSKWGFLERAIDRKLS